MSVLAPKIQKHSYYKPKEPKECSVCSAKIIYGKKCKPCQADAFDRQQRKNKEERNRRYRMKQQMKITEKAFAYAQKKHAGQIDDEGKDFFQAHPVTVSLILRCTTDDENVIAAGLLHDVIEDTDTTYEELVEEFGKDIADLVNEVTEEGQKDAHGKYFPRLKTQRGVMVKLADRLSNLSRMSSWSKERKDHYVRKTIAGFPTEGPKDNE